MKKQHFFASTGLWILLALWNLLRLDVVEGAPVVITNCFEMNIDGERCNLCDKGYFLNWTSTSCSPQLVSVQTDLWCIQKDWFNACIRCDCGYLLIKDKGTCSRATVELIGCEVIDSQYTCIRPKKEYVLQNTTSTEIFVRYAKNSHCEVETYDFICLMCHSGYYLDSSRNCIRVLDKIDNVWLSFYYGTELRSRNSGYAPGNLGVFPVIRYCSSYKSKGDGYNGICTKCYSGMITNKEFTECVVKPCDFCAYAQKVIVGSTTRIECTECLMNNFYFVYTHPTSQVQSCVLRSNFLFDNCYTRTSNLDECTACVAGFTLDAYKRCVLQQWETPIPLDATPSIEGCLIALNSIDCQVCASGYELDSKRCLKLPANCVDTTYGTTDCNQCSNMYYATGTPKVCQLLNAYLNCRQADGISDKCVKCAPLYKADASGACQKITEFDNCVHSDGLTDTCIYCENLYYIPISPMPPGCIKIPDYEYCVVSNGKTDVCNQCLKNYTFDYANQVCAISFIFQTDCENEPGYYFKGGICYKHTFENYLMCIDYDNTDDKCNRCISGYFVQPGQKYCKKLTSTMCYSNGIDDKCSFCTTNKYYISPLFDCSLTTTTCTNNKFSDKCTECILSGQLGYWVNSPPTCVIGTSVSNPYCIRFSTSTPSLVCELCDNLFYLDGSFACQSLAGNPGCEYSDGINPACILCKKGYKYVSSATPTCVAEPNIPHCVSNTEIVCTKCNNGYYINANTGKCLPISNPTCLTSLGILNECPVATCKTGQNFINSDYPHYCGFPFCTLVSSSACVECEIGYYLNLVGECSRLNMDNCINQSAENRCILCDPKFYIAVGFQGEVDCFDITKAIPNCLYGNGITKSCLGCATNYYLTSDGLCATIENCTTIDFDLGICTLCNATNLVISSDGKMCITMPVTCSLTNKVVCTECNASGGFYLTPTNECVVIRDCKTSVDGIVLECATCKDGFSLDPTTKQCYLIQKIDNCIEYLGTASPAECLTCAYNYYLNAAKNTCTYNTNTNSGNCPQLLPSLQYECSPQCDTLSDGKAQSTCYFDFDTAVTPPISDCFLYNGFDKLDVRCAYCNRGYYYDATSKKCVILAPPTYTDCGMNSFHEQLCLFCEQGFYWDGSKCTALDTAQAGNCQFTRGQGNRCETCSKAMLPKVSASDATLFVCSSYTKISNLRQGCVKYSTTQACTECSPNFYLNGRGDCLPRARFDACVEYDPLSDNCKKCLPHYALTTSSKHPLLKQTPLAHDMTKYCALVPTSKFVVNCVGYDALFQCVTCKNSGQYGDLVEYFLDTATSPYKCVFVANLKCSEITALSFAANSCSKVSILNCKTYDATYTSCLECNSLYYLSSSTACNKQMIVANCDKYYATAAGCEECSNLYHKNVPGTCTLITNSANCQTSELNNDNCSLCVTDYSISFAGPCISNPLGYCTSLKSGDAECDICNEGFAPQPSSIICISESYGIPNCLTSVIALPENFLKCTACKTGYFLSKGQQQCIPLTSTCQITNCVTLNQDSHLEWYYCDVCDANYYVNEIQRCSIEITTTGGLSDNLADPADDVEFAMLLDVSFVFLSILALTF